MAGEKPQNSSVNEVVASSSFLFGEEWGKYATGDFDYVIVGSSFCAMGFLCQVLKNRPDAKILIVERGQCVCFRSHSPLGLRCEEKKTEEFPWKFSSSNGGHIHRVRGMNHFLGGRSSFWKAWCPKPTRDEMAEWPLEVIQKVQQYFPAAETLLSVRPVNEIVEKGDRLFGRLQNIIFGELESAPSNIEAITRIQHAPLAITEKKCSYGDHQKYCALEPLFDILRDKRNVKAITGCLVKRIHHKNGRAELLETSEGDLFLGRAKLILAMSTLPSTTLMLNSFSPSSFPQMSNIGKRFTAHFASYIFARVPFDKSTEMYASIQDRVPDRLEMAAIYIAGKDSVSDHQFHIQLTAAAVGEKAPNGIYDTMRNLLKTPSNEMLTTCENHIVFVCASLGQLDHHNPANRFQLNDNVDIEHNTTLHFAENKTDNALWGTMDRATFEILDHLTPCTTIEYWNSETKIWQADRPPVEQIRSRSLVHPASTMWIGGDTEPSPVNLNEPSPVNLDYRFRGVDNVYLTGGALWPTGASWNPTCAMTAMAMDLADRLSSKQVKSEL